ncbi:MAG: JAB domain-containing protein [Limisphaerales bacterium]
MKPSARYPAEFRLQRLRELPADLPLCDTPELAHQYWERGVTGSAWYNPEVEQLVVFFLNTRRRITGFHLVSMGTLDTILCHPREVFRVAIVAAAGAIIVAHNLCEAPHKLCYVTHRFMCSHAAGEREFPQQPRRRKCYA